ncbi:Cytochrome P450 [Thermomonospora echinospora]|uniref:Cytochrome P450 n=1 Tax=Thermomonospora echinospora TaxID=1992 RepID=A0A1H5ZZT0_9ACTN|nr:cytochrome P450 [Thermomonospora echinospora]SEG41285.1 Cytochrome P450 [Thermomonospora echinospora]
MTAVQRPVVTSARPSRVNQASVADTLRIGATVLVPTVARGVLARRPRIVRLAEAIDADRRAGDLLQRMRSRYGPGPLLLRLPGRRLALVLSPGDVERVLTGSPEPFSPANLEKRSALSQFQPHGVLISDAAKRPDRRRFNEAVLDTSAPVHRYGEAITAKVREEAELLREEIGRTGELDWDTFRVAWWRVIRRVVLGDAARDDSEISDLLTRLRMSANWAYAMPRRRILRHRFQHRLRHYLDLAEPGSLAELVARAPSTSGTEPADQVPQWLFAFEPAGMAAYRALALLATHPDQARKAREEVDGRDLEQPQDLPYLRACVQESVRLWPTTLALLRETTAETAWDGTRMPAGTALLVHTPFLQRDDRTLPYADTFAPWIWLDGTARRSWSDIPFSGGPVECPGRNLVLLTTGLFLAMLIQRHEYRLASGQPLTYAQPLPRTLGPFGLRFQVRPRSTA